MGGAEMKRKEKEEKRKEIIVGVLRTDGYEIDENKYLISVWELAREDERRQVEIARKLHLGAIGDLRDMGFKVDLRRLGAGISAESKRVRIVETKPLFGKPWYYVENREETPVLLGTVRVFERWGAYSFFPERDVVLSSDCMEFIASFVRKLNEERGKK